jgi:hypothetical protein
MLANNSGIAARTYKLSDRTVSLIEALAFKDSRTRGEVLAACAGLLARTLVMVRVMTILRRLSSSLDSGDRL